MQSNSIGGGLAFHSVVEVEARYDNTDTFGYGDSVIIVSSL